MKILVILLSRRAVLLLQWASLQRIGDEKENRMHTTEAGKCFRAYTTTLTARAAVGCFGRFDFWFVNGSVGSYHPCRRQFIEFTRTEQSSRLVQSSRKLYSHGTIYFSKWSKLCKVYVLAPTDLLYSKWMSIYLSLFSFSVLTFCVQLHGVEKWRNSSGRHAPLFVNFRCFVIAARWVFGVFIADFQWSTHITLADTSSIPTKCGDKW